MSMAIRKEDKKKDKKKEREPTLGGGPLPGTGDSGAGFETVIAGYKFISLQQTSITSTSMKSIST